MSWFVSELSCQRVDCQRVGLSARCLSSERKYLEHSLLRSESSTGAKVPWNESSWTFRPPGANVPRNESSTGAKVLSMVFSLPEMKVQRNENATYLQGWYCKHWCSEGVSLKSDRASGATARTAAQCENCH